MTIALQVEVPIACFRQSRAREYAETYPVPPPATIYGMLLSIVGETDRYKHCGTRLAMGMIFPPEQSETDKPEFSKSTVIRTFRRFKKKEISDPTNARPDYQELLTDIKFVVWVDSIGEQGQPKLTERLPAAFAHPETVDRFGGLCLGESRDLVNTVSLVPENYQDSALWWLVQNRDGLLTLPYWVDHVGSQGTRWRRYTLQKIESQSQPPDLAWTEIQSN